MNAIWTPGKSNNLRRDKNVPIANVIHIAEGTFAGTVSWFQDPRSPALAHFVVGKRENECVQMARFQDACVHAGWNKGIWKLHNGISPNFRTIGIENAGFTGEKFTDWQYRCNAWIISVSAKRFSFPINEDTVIGHYQLDQVNRKNCPGTGIDFQRLIKMAREWKD